MLKNLLFLLLILCSFSLQLTRAQQPSKADSVEVNLLLEQLNHLLERNLDSALLLSKQVQGRAASLHHQEGLWETQIIQGKAFFLMGQKDTAYSILNQVLRESQQQQKRLIQIRASIQLASSFEKDYDFKNAITPLIQAERLLANNDDIDLKFDILNTLGTLHRKMKNYSNALAYFNQLDSSYFYQLTKKQRFMLSMNKGNVYATQRNYSEAEAFFNKAYNEIQTIDSPREHATITYNLGALYYRQKRYKQAEEYITKSLEANIKLGDQLQIERCYRVLGAINLDQDNYKQAEAYFLQALGIARKAQNSKSVLGNYKNLYLNYWHMGYQERSVDHMEKALQYFEKWAHLNDSIYQLETAEKILELEKQYETEKKNNQITLLEKENQLKEDQIYIQRTQRNYLIVFTILVVGILAVFIYFYYYYKKVNRLLQLQGQRILSQRNKISTQNEKLQKSIHTQNKLFSIIAHDLRSPLVSISNVSKLIGFYLADNRMDDLKQVTRMMDQKNDQVLELTDNLLSWAKSQTAGLKPFYESVSIREIIEECFDLYISIAESKEIHLSCPTEEDQQLWGDRNMVKTICRNLINNAIKFTPREGSIQVEFRQIENEVTVCVKDSGIGVPKDKQHILFSINRDKVTPGTEGEKSSGLGLTVCQEFVHAMGGTIWVESNLKQGSTFCFKLPSANSCENTSKQERKTQTLIPSIN